MQGGHRWDRQHVMTCLDALTCRTSSSPKSAAAEPRHQTSRIEYVEDKVPSWWRLYWGVVTIAIMTLLVIDEDYSLVLPSLVGLGAACLGFEYLAGQNARKPSD